jgi:isoleucyl-tRNA synthetase
MDTGSGMVHIAPAFGEDDFRACKQEGLGFLQLVDPNGKFLPEVTDFAGRFCKEADRDILKQPPSARRALPRRGLPPRLPVLLARHGGPPHPVRPPQLVHPHDAGNRSRHREQQARSTGSPSTSRKAVSGRSSAPTWTGPSRASATGARRCPSGSTTSPAQDGSPFHPPPRSSKNPNAFDHFRAAQKANPEISDHLMVHKPWIDDVTWTARRSRACTAASRGHRLLVRLGLHALRPVGLPPPGEGGV